MLNRIEWDADEVLDDVRRYLVDNSATPVRPGRGRHRFPEKGTRSAGVQRQYSGAARRTENCQVGVFVAYATDRGRTLIDRRLYLPTGKAEPRPPEREAYARLLKQLAALYPAPQSTGAPQEDTAITAPAAQARLTGGASETTATAEAGDPPAAPPAPVPHGAATQRPVPRAERAPQSSRRPTARKDAPADTPAPDGAYAHGPLLVLDADTERQVTGYGVGGLILDVPAKSLPALVEWTLTEARIGSEKLHTSGKDGDPLLVLT